MINLFPTIRRGTNHSHCRLVVMLRGASRTAATSKMERSILDVAAVLDPPLMLSRVTG